ncbi:MAG: serine hydrolase domain-containing protein [Candidatus Aquirickettsiella gammari]
MKKILSNTSFFNLGRALCFATALSCSTQVQAQTSSLAPDTEKAIDALAIKALADSSVPSVSIAIVKDGKIAFAKAYGDARSSPKMAATPEMRYKIASNSKQITAAAILLLVEDKKLSLDDRVARFFPKLTRAKDISVRQLLNHTSGYQDYYAVDYLQPSMQGDITPDGILALYAQKPLDFEPGTRWQYSNTNYVLLGRIVEKVSAQPLATFLQKRIFDKLAMHSVIDIGATAMGANDPAGHTRYALGPVREVSGEGKGWMWATGHLAMSASDLAKWDISLMNGTILKPASIKLLSTAGMLKDGNSTRYALGLDVSQMANGHRRWGHTGGASGFLSANRTYPDDRIAITVLTNGEGSAFRSITQDIEKLIFAEAADPHAASSLERTRQLFMGLQKGALDRASVTDDLYVFFTPAILADFASSLAPLGDIASIVQNNKSDRGGMAHRSFTITTASKKKLDVAVYVKPDGRFDQYLVSEKN